MLWAGPGRAEAGRGGGGGGSDRTAEPDSLRLSCRSQPTRLSVLTTEVGSAENVETKL